MHSQNILLFDERRLQEFREMKNSAMFSCALRDLPLPPIRNARSFNVVRDDKMMERAGVGPRSARTLPWFENERETFQHHAEYLQRLSKLREELIKEEQTNLASALDRLKMRSYGKEYIYSRPKEKTFTKRHSALSETPQRKALITTLEKFQRMRPKKLPPTIMPLEGKSLLEMPTTDRVEKHHGHSKATTERSVDESVRLNLQRLNGHTVASIPRGRNTYRDMFVENSTMFRGKPVKSNDANHNSSGQEEKILQIQKQRQRALRMKQEALRAEQARLAPQSFRLDNMNDEDKMNLDSLKDYYCVYYIPAPSPEHLMPEKSDFLPSIPAQQSCPHINSETSLKNGKGGVPLEVKYGQSRGNRVCMPDMPLSPCTCNSKMFISGSKMEASFSQTDACNSKQPSFYNRHDTGAGGGKSGNGSNRNNSRETERDEWSNTQHYGLSKNHTKNSLTSDKTHATNGFNGDKRQIIVDMPTIVFNAPKSPEPSGASASSGGLVKAFKQKELRQKELNNLMEDVKELNKRTETLVNYSVD